MDKKMYDLFKAQIGHEQQNAEIYLNIASTLHKMGLDNLAEFFEKQSQDELGHKKQLFDFLKDRNQVVSTPTVTEYNFDNKPVKDMISFFLKREQETTTMIANMIDNCQDYIAEKFLKEFIYEQREEEAIAQTMCDRILPLADDMKFLVLFDAEFEVD